MMLIKKHQVIQLGFSLIEMAIVLFIVALLLGGLLPTVSGQLDKQHRNETRKQMEEITSALMGFAISNGRLPCPASAVIGIEDFDSATSQCKNDGTGVRHVGYLPWATLGVSQIDGWGRVFRYSATPAFTTSATTFSSSTPRDITIKKRDSSGTLNNLSIANDIPAVIVSHGSNGIFGTLDNGINISSTAPTSYNHVKDQITNVSGVLATGDPLGRVFITGDQAGRTAGDDEEFDDMVVWISPNILINRMVAAGKLP